MRFDVSIDGDAELQRAIGSLLPKLEKKVLRQAMREAAKSLLLDVRAAIRQIRQTGKQTDPLSRGMTIKALKRGRIGVRIETPTRAKLGIPASAKNYYPAHIELGSRNEPAEPYMRGPLDQGRQELTRKARNRIIAGIEREAGRG